MRRLAVVAVLAVVGLGCAQAPVDGPAPGMPCAVAQNNPAFLPVADPHLAWETVVDTVDDYFKIEREEPVRQIGGTLTEGRLDTFPQVSPTLLEPWRPDATGRYERLENTLQSLRRRAVARVIPTQGGYLVDVAVFKELEDVVQPERATAGKATFRYDDTLRHVVNPIGEQQITEGWIPQGRDPLLEQKILADLLSRATTPAYPGMVR